MLLEINVLKHLTFLMKGESWKALHLLQGPFKPLNVFYRHGPRHQVGHAGFVISGVFVFEVIEILIAFVFVFSKVEAFLAVS